MENELELIIGYCKMMEKEGEKNFPPDEYYLRGMKLVTKNIINYCKQLMALRSLETINSTTKEGEGDGEHNAVDRYDLA
jgi:hypothetical protein